MTRDGRPQLRRRDLLKFAATTTALGPIAARGSALPAPAAEEGEVLRTDLCELLQCRYPVVLAPMGGVGNPQLTAAVSAAGGFGILPGAGTPPDELRKQIREVRRLTDRPFGVNLLLHPEIRQTKDPASIAPEVLARVQAVLNRFRQRLGLAPSTARPAAPPAITDAAIEVILEERPHVFSIGLGKPASELVSRCHERGMKMIAMVATLPAAVEVAATGVDAIVAQGGEAGGHRSTWVKGESAERAAIGTLALVPQVARAVKAPVIAAGGIMDGRGVAAALLLGARGAYLGTRFIASAESGAPPFYKKALLEADSDATTITDVFTGLYARLLRNAFIGEYRASGAPVLPPGLQQAARHDITEAAAKKGDPSYFPMYSGQGVGMIDDLPLAGDLVHRIVREARELLAAAPRFLQPA